MKLIDYLLYPFKTWWKIINRPGVAYSLGGDTKNTKERIIYLLVQTFFLFVIIFLVYIILYLISLLEINF